MLSLHIFGSALAIKLRFLPLLILLIGAFFRFHALVGDARFHPDEALFATFARKAVVNGDWLLHGALDKTPLSIYAGAVSMMLVGVRPLPNGVLTLDIHAGEFAARLPGTLASILLIAAMYATAKALYPDHQHRRLCFTPLIAVFLTAFSPYGLAFSATAFTDGLMLLCVVLALWMGARQRWFWAGVWLAVGFACKQQALFYIPLILAVGWLSSSRDNHLLKDLLRLSLPILVGFGMLLLWDSARGEISGVWALAAANNDPGGWARPDQLIPPLNNLDGLCRTHGRDSVVDCNSAGIINWRSDCPGHKPESCGSDSHRHCAVHIHPRLHWVSLVDRLPRT